MSAARMDFESVAQLALSQAHDLLPRWFPAGRFRGREFVVGDLSGAPGESLSINVQTGQWSDFATDDRGGDLISLYAARNRVKQIEAAQEISALLGSPVEQRPRSAIIMPITTPESPEWDGIFPVPADAPTPFEAHPRYGAPVHVARYRDAYGRILALVYRCEPANSRKQVVPLTYCRSTKDGRQAWRWQSLPKPRHLYHLEMLADRPRSRVLLVEGEPKCDAATAALGDSFVCVTWPGGAMAWKHADWQPLARRDVVIWPDADEPGIEAAGHIADQLRSRGSNVRVLKPPQGIPDGWDIGDAIKDGWSADRLRSFIDPPANPLPLVFFDEIRPSFDTHDFVEGVLLEASAAVIYGESNSGKTFFALDLALHVAAGITWRDREVLQGGVVYVVLEGSVLFRNRVEAWRRQFDSDARVCFAAVPSAVNLLDPAADTPRLIDTIRIAAETFGMPVKLVIIDTLSRAMAGGNENAPDDMGSLVANMDSIRAATGAAVAFVHHSGKDQAKGARGHSLLRAAIDTEIEVAEQDDGGRAATVVKQRELEKGDVFGFSLQSVTLGQDKRGKPVTSCVVVGQPQGHSAGQASNLLSGLSGHLRRALEVLFDVLTEQGKVGFIGVPEGIPSVPEDWWRQRFYDRTLSDGKEVTQDAKLKAFNRAAQSLMDKHLIAVSKGRVWVIWKARESETSLP